MIYFSPAQTGGDTSSNANLKSSDPDDLVQHIQELEQEVQDLRGKLRRKERHDASSSAENTPYEPVHVHEDGYSVLTQQRVAVLIDVQNMYYAARNLYNSKLEFSKLLSFLARGRMLVRAIAYIVERPGMEQEKFIEVLRRNGYEVRKKLLIERSDGSQKGDWDLGIALDAVSLSDKVDSVILVTGDGDFVTLVYYLHSKGIRVEVASFPETTSLELVRASSYFHKLSEKVLLPGAQFNLIEPEEGEEGEESSSSGRRPGRSPYDDQELLRKPRREEVSDVEDDDFEL